MKRIARSTTIVLVPALVLGLAVLFGPNASAEEDGTFDGRLVIGYRNVDVSGQDNKYREDINLDEGPRLADLDFSLTPDGTLRDFVDRIQLNVNDLGGQPFENIRLAVEKFGRFDFDYNRTESQYFYNDQLFPEELVSERNGRAGDFHTFNFRRVRDRASLKLDLTPRAKLSFGFDRYSKIGQSTTTLDLQRDEVELDRPLNENQYQYNGGFQYAWDKVTVVLDERYTKYDNAYEIFSPGQQVGSSVLDYFFLNQPYNFKSWDHTVRIVATPVDRFTIRASGTVQNLDMDLSSSERAGGVGFTGSPYTTDATGNGAISRDTDLYDLDLTYVLTDQWALVGSYYYRNLDQTGDLIIDGTPNRGHWEITTDGIEAGVQWSGPNHFTVTVGGRTESRDVKRTVVEEGAPEETETPPSTNNDGFYGTIGWKPVKGLDLTLDYEDSSIDDPFTRISATDRTRTRFTGRYRLDNGFWFSGTYQKSEYKNSKSSWDGNHEYYTGKVGYQNDRLNAQVGYSVVQIDQSILSNTNDVAMFNINYGVDSDFVEGLLRYRVTEALWLGGQLRLYDNTGTFGIKRDDYQLYGEYHFTQGYLFRVGYQSVDYNEKAYNFDDYNADIYDFGVGFTW